MVCSSPLTIRNPTLDYRSGLDSCRLIVPCGHCDSCVCNRQNEISLRLSTHLYFQSKRGYRFGFCTLTYDDNNLPRFSSFQFSESSDTFPNFSHLTQSCFNHSHILTFINSLRKHFSRKHSLNGIQYFVASEYGSNTKRPHYHLILGFPPCDLSDKYLHSCVSRFWSYGFIFPRHYCGGVDSHGYTHKPFIVESSSSSAKYISKYSTKDAYFYSLPQVNEAISLYGKKQLSKHLPRIFQSQGIGALPDDIAVTDDIINNGYFNSETMSFVPLSNYTKNKLLYDIYYLSDGSPRRRLSSFGISYYSNNFHTLIDSSVSNYKKGISFYLNNISLFEPLNIPLSFIENNLQDIALYELCLRNVECSPRFFSLDLFEHCKKLYIKKHSICRGVRLSSPDNVKFSYNHLPQFEFFDTIIDYLSLFCLKSSELKALEIINNNNSSNYLKNLYSYV